ncbi:hypothetical protein QLH52_14335 [Methylomonas sp. OY6]|uniref:Uncharacterized protein n=1 Tax=Methylomonas defluvii TaxID=3045149 RepID=A0ABU4UG66_9GAMM|nr:hypothetical protein [Methylomonas sp. OY6]MDX8128468.1 hypothetical protein [Methylomonas sp. OY6]
MTRKFEVYFSSATSLSPSIVYISPSEGYTEHFSVGILYQVNLTGTFDSASGIIKNFDFKQNLTSSEQEALDWATTWLTQKSGCIVSLNEVTV